LFSQNESIFAAVDRVDAPHQAVDLAMKNRREQLEKDLQDSYIEDLAFWIGDLTDTPQLEPSTFWDLLGQSLLPLSPCPPPTPCPAPSISMPP